MKKVLISIHPKWCKLIFSGEKTIEVRKTAPKLETPFKVYVYCTKERMTRVPSMYAYLHKNEPRACAEYGTIETWGEIGDVIVNPHLASKHVSFGMHGKVIGSFVCDRITNIHCYSDTKDTSIYEPKTCLTGEEICKYLNYEDGYGWHITELKLFDKPRELCEFCVPCKEYDSNEPHCGECEYYSYSPNDSGDAQEECLCGGCKRLRRPPMSWQYVEDHKEEIT